MRVCILPEVDINKAKKVFHLVTTVPLSCENFKVTVVDLFVYFILYRTLFKTNSNGGAKFSWQLIKETKTVLIKSSTP